MVILGIDPGIAIVGWGVLHYDGFRFRPMAYGSIQTKAGQKTEERLRQVYDGLCGIIDKYKPDAMSIEELFWNTNQKTGIVVAEARGVILLTCNKLLGDEVYEYTPNQIKMTITGYGGAEKKQMQLMVQALLRLKAIPRPDDAADALAVALCHGQVAGMAGQFRVK